MQAGGWILGPALGSHFRGRISYILALEGAVAPALCCSTPLRPLGLLSGRILVIAAFH